MRQLIKLIITILFLSVIAVQITGCQYIEQLLPRSTREITPKEIYHDAWEIIKTEYFYKDYNSVDWNYWEHRYDKVLLTHEDAYVAIETMLESLNDRYTRLLPPEQFEEQDTDIAAKISGIGIQIAEKENDIIIVSVLEGTPAFKSHLLENDKITAVNDLSTQGKDLKQVADQIRGKIGTTVKLTIKRKNQKIIFHVKRDVIKIKAVQQKMLGDNISYIRLNSFISQNAGDEMEEAILGTPNASAYIVDLRGNYGGLLPNAISISNIFLDRGSKIVSIIEKSGNEKSIRAIARSLTDKPVIVLINGASASASEILSGALKDNHRALLVGEKTFGKGLVQKIFNLPDGSGINVTVSKYLTPNGTDINEKGISPDFEVKLKLKDLRKGNDTQLEEAKKIALQAIKAKRIASSN